MPALGAVCLFFMTYVYLDESGDLGWSFDKPFGCGGSSRYLTISALVIPEKLIKYPQRIIKEIYSAIKLPPGKEMKGYLLKSKIKEHFAEKTSNLIIKNSDIKLLSITTYKPNVQVHIRKDHNKLYNYMTGLVLLNDIKDYPEVTFMPDERSIKVKSGNSLVDYLHQQLKLEYGSNTQIINKPQQSHKVLNIQFVDIVANIIWKHYEISGSNEYNILNRCVGQKQLFFPRPQEHAALLSGSN